MSNTNRYKAIFYALALLVCGGVLGAMIESARTATPQTLRLGRVEEIAKVIRDRLVTKLELTGDQQTQIEPMIKKTAEEMEASHLESLKRVNRALDNLHEQIMPQLTPEQRQKMVELETERAKRMYDKYRYRPAVTNAAPQ